MWKNLPSEIDIKIYDNYIDFFFSEIHLHFRA